MKKIIRRRSIKKGNTLCEHPLLDRIYRARSIQNPEQLNRTFKAMLDPAHLFGIDCAIDLLVEARKTQQKILIIGDFDADGATATALSVSALRQLGFKHVSFLIPDRFEQGYGLSLEVADLALATQADLVMTVDNGVSSLEGVRRLKEQGVNVIITDHHLPCQQLPPADAIVNPNLAQCTFPSKSLAGVGVAFYVMLALRAKLREIGIISVENQPNFTTLLDLVALGTVADVVPLDQNNRILVYQGLQRIQAKQCRCGILALVEIAQRRIETISTADLGFAVAPRLNAAGRLDNMALGVELLLTEEMENARALAFDLDTLNRTRKEIEQGMKTEALKIYQNLTALSDIPPFAIALYQPDWHQGVLGILAARIKEYFHRPVIAFAKESDGILKGSARSIEGVHIRDLLEHIATRHPDLILKFGGHSMAAGLSIRESDFPQFQQIFNRVTEAFLQHTPPQNILLTDGELSETMMNLETAAMLKQAGPWGQAFPEPVFDGEFKILQQRLVGECHLKMMVEPKNGGPLLDAIAFNIDPRRYPDLSIKYATLVYKLDINEFRGRHNVQLLIDYLEPTVD